MAGAQSVGNHIMYGKPKGSPQRPRVRDRANPRHPSLARADARRTIGHQSSLLRPGLTRRQPIGQDRWDKDLADRDRKLQELYEKHKAEAEAAAAAAAGGKKKKGWLW